MKFIIFYSWQSDLPNNTNRGFIETVIEKGIKLIGHEENFEIEPSLDRDTQGTPGSPNISQTILDKIKSCDVFVADISIVTGSRSEKQRLSPNPNVLIELGYAVSCLGWEKIILFCNEIYGSGEDLPFDIRQHRRIPFELRPEEPKAPVRDALSKLIKARLVEIIENSDFKKQTKRPFLLAEWNFIDKDTVEPDFEGISSKELKLHIPKQVNDFSKLIEKEIREVIGIDGSIDPNWTTKVDKFKKGCEEFLKKIGTKKGWANYLLKKNAISAVPVTFSVTNDGTLPATDIRCELSIPDWLLIFEDWPDDDQIPVKPIKPVPEQPRKGLRVGDAIPRSFVHSSFLNKTSFDHLLAPRNRTSGFYLKNNIIVFWADKLLHKHTLTKKDDRLYFLAKPDILPGMYTIDCNIFCVEYDDWEKTELKIAVIDQLLDE